MSCSACGETVWITLATYEQIHPDTTMCEACAIVTLAFGDARLMPLDEHPNRERFDQGALETFRRVKAASEFLRARGGGETL